MTMTQASNTLGMSRMMAITQATMTIPIRQGSYFPDFLEARKTSEQTLVDVHLGGLDRRRLGGQLVQAMGLNRISKRTVSKLCKDITSCRCRWSSWFYGRLTLP